VLLATVVPSYLLFLGASKTLVQSVTVGLSLMAVLQFWSGRLFGGPRRRIAQSLLWSVYPACWMAYAAVASMGWARLPGWIWTPLFVLTCFGIAAVMHSGGPAYAEMVLENTPMGRRGRLASLRGLGQGVAGLIGVSLVTWLMSRSEEPANFHLCFFVGPAIMMASCVSPVFLSDSGASYGPAPAGGAPFAAARVLLGNFNFRVFLIFHLFAVVAQSFAPLLIGYGRDVLSLGALDTGKFTVAYFAGTLAIGIPMPLLADRFGFRLIGILGALLTATAFLASILLPDSRIVLLTAYALLSGSVNLTALVLANLGSELVPDVKPATIIAVGSIAILPATLSVASLAGRLADAYGPGGYLAAFVLGAALSLCAILGFALVVREPRTGQELYIRMRGV
jgi:MFS family permease